MSKRRYDPPPPAATKDNRTRESRAERGVSTRHDPALREEDWWTVPDGSPAGRVEVQVNVPGSNASQ